MKASHGSKSTIALPLEGGGLGQCPSALNPRPTQRQRSTMRWTSEDEWAVQPYGPSAQ
jgi:hypothetical protein